MANVSLGKNKKSYDSLAAAARANGIPYITLYQRVHVLGWSVADALKTEVRTYSKRQRIFTKKSKAAAKTAKKVTAKKAVVRAKAKKAPVVAVPAQQAPEQQLAA